MTVTCHSSWGQMHLEGTDYRSTLSGGQGQRWERKFAQDGGLCGRGTRERGESWG